MAVTIEGTWSPSSRRAVFAWRRTRTTSISWTPAATGWRQLRPGIWLRHTAGCLVVELRHYRALNGIVAHRGPVVLGRPGIERFPRLQQHATGGRPMVDNTFSYGDVVQVTGTSTQLAPQRLV